MAGRSLPGADKYRTAPAGRDAPWLHPLVAKANAEVRIEDVLNGYFGLAVPYEAEGWKVRCPFAVEHKDGGIDPQFRVYATSNTGYCFALHGRLDPVGLWRQRSYFPTIKDAAENLMTTFGVEYRPRPYRERMRLLQVPEDFHADPEALVEALQTYLAHHPLYQACELDDFLLRGVNYELSEVHAVCLGAQRLEDVERWLKGAKDRLNSLLAQRTAARLRPSR